MKEKFEFLHFEWWKKKTSFVASKGTVTRKCSTQNPFKTIIQVPQQRKGEEYYGYESSRPGIFGVTEESGSRSPERGRQRIQCLDGVF